MAAPPFGAFAKISRYGEAFWVRDVRELEPGVFVGVADNDTDAFALGDTVAFVSKEITDVLNHPKPTLSVVGAE